MLSKPVKKLLIVSASIATSVLVGGGFLLWLLQDKLIYFPNFPDKLPSNNPYGYRSPDEQGFEYDDVKIQTPDGVKLHGWLTKTTHPKESPTIVVFQGNAGNIGDRLPFLKELNNVVGANTLIVGYRGYSYSEGTPSEKGLQTDSLAIMEHVFTRTDIDTKRIYVLGTSIGGAVGIYALTRGKGYNVAGLILENTFTSMADMVDQVMPRLAPFKGLILANHWKSLDLIGKVKVPILFISGTADELVPPEQMEKLFDSAKESPLKELVEIDGGTHNDTWYVGRNEYFKGIIDFIAKCDILKKTPKL